MIRHAPDGFRISAECAERIECCSLVSRYAVKQTETTVSTTRLQVPTTHDDPAVVGSGGAGVGVDGASFVVAVSACVERL